MSWCEASWVTRAMSAAQTTGDSPRYTTRLSTDTPTAFGFFAAIHGDLTFTEIGTSADALDFGAVINQ
jgi:hypothetical protein